MLAHDTQNFGNYEFLGIVISRTLIMSHMRGIFNHDFQISNLIIV